MPRKDDPTVKQLHTQQRLSLVRAVKSHAALTGTTISNIVERALEAYLASVGVEEVK